VSKLKALFFDCDGVIAETEKDGHREAFNRAFKEFGLDVVWDVEEYGELVKVSGGKERMKYYFSAHRELIKNYSDLDELIKKLHKRKTEIFMSMCENGELPLRSGVKRLMENALQEGLLLGICSTSNERSVTSLIRGNLGEEWIGKFNGIFAGDIVSEKKPSPEIYNIARTAFKVDPENCFVVEDTKNGLLSAKAAGMKCIITPSYYSKEEDFSEADIVVSSLGDPCEEGIRILRSVKKTGEAYKYVDIKMLEKFM